MYLLIEYVIKYIINIFLQVIKLYIDICFETYAVYNNIILNINKKRNVITLMNFVKTQI